MSKPASAGHLLRAVATLLPYILCAPSPETSLRSAPVNIDSERLNALESLIHDLRNRLSALRGYL